MDLTRACEARVLPVGSPFGGFHESINTNFTMLWNFVVLNGSFVVVYKLSILGSFISGGLDLGAV